MPKKNSNTTLKNSVSVRFCNAHYNILVRDAELKNESVAEHIRQTISDQIEQKTFQEQLVKLERSLASRVFSIVCAVANLSEHEREIVKMRLNGGK